MTSIGNMELLILCAVSLVLLLLVALATWLIVSKNRQKETRVCPNCEQINPAINDHCSKCGASLTG